MAENNDDNTIPDMGAIKGILSDIRTQATIIKNRLTFMANMISNRNTYKHKILKSRLIALEAEMKALIKESDGCMKYENDSKKGACLDGLWKRMKTRMKKAKKIKAEIDNLREDNIVEILNDTIQSLVEDDILEVNKGNYSSVSKGNKDNG